MSIVATARTGTAELDAAIAELHAGNARWAALSHLERARLLVETFSTVGGVAERWADAAARAKGLPPDAQAAGEEWLTGPYALLDGTSAYAEALLGLAARGSTLGGARFRRAPGDRVAVRVLPEGAQQWVLFNGFTADVWMRPGVSVEQVKADAGLGARRLGEAAGVALVLGAGNISAIGPLDVLYELVAHNRSAILKVNPTFSPLVTVYRDALRPLIEFGVVRVVDGDGTVGAYLVEHDGIDKVHITGSGATHDLIVWGAGRGGGTPSRGERPEAHQGDHERTRRGRAGHRRARSVVPGGPPIPGGARRDDAAPQRRAQLHRRAGRRPEQRLAAEGGVRRGAPPRARSPCAPRALVPGQRGEARAGAGESPGRRAAPRPAARRGRLRRQR